MTLSYSGLVLVPLIAVFSPVLARTLSPWVRVPIVVFELVLGIVVGPSVLGWVQPDDLFATLSDFGLAMLFFVAGSEIQFPAIRGRPVRRAGLGWLISLALGVIAGFVLADGEGIAIVAIALASTALGTLVPILRDAGEMSSPFGRAVFALGAVGEFGPLLAISLFLSGRNVGTTTFVLIGFAIVAAVAIVVAMRVPQGRLHTVMRSTLHTSGQFAVRVVILILCALVVLSVILDLDMLLGAFAAGVVWQLLMRNAPEEDRSAVESKVEAVAFGLLIPIFFIYTGITFDLAALLADPVSLALVPIAVVLLLIVRGLPSTLVAPPGSSVRDRVALGLMGATGLPIIVAVTAIGRDAQLIDPGLAAALVGAAMLSVLIFPGTAMAIRGERVRATPWREPSEEEA